MASLLFVLLGKRQWHPHHTLQDLPAPTTSEERRGHTVLRPLWNPLSGATVQAPIGGQRALGLLLALHSQYALGAPLASPWVTSFPETLQLLLSTCHHLAFPQRTGCRAGSRSVTSPFANGSETSTCSLFPSNSFVTSYLTEADNSRTTPLPMLH